MVNDIMCVFKVSKVFIMNMGTICKIVNDVNKAQQLWKSDIAPYK